MEIGDGLKQIREENHLTQEELGFRLGVSRQSISNWENNKSLPDVLSMLRLSDIYQVSIDEMLRGKDAVEQMNTDYSSWRDGYNFCRISVNDVYVTGSELTWPQNPYNNKLDFNPTRLRFVKVFYTEKSCNEFSLPLNIPYTDIQYAKLLVTRRLIWRYKVMLHPSFRYYFHLQLKIKNGVILNLEMNPLYEMKKAFDLLHSHVPYEDVFHIFEQFPDEKLFYAGEISEYEKHFFTDGFESYANAHYEEWKEKYSLVNLIVNNQPFSMKQKESVHFEHVYKSIPLTEEEMKRFNGDAKTVHFGMGLVLFWTGIVILLVVLSFFIPHS